MFCAYWSIPRTRDWPFLKCLFTHAGNPCLAKLQKTRSLLFKGLLAGDKIVLFFISLQSNTSQEGIFHQSFHLLSRNVRELSEGTPPRLQLFTQLFIWEGVKNILHHWKDAKCCTWLLSRTKRKNGSCISFVSRLVLTSQINCDLYNIIMIDLACQIKSL